MIVDEKGIKDSWKDYMEKLMNEENEWGRRISAGVKEGPADSRNDTNHRGYWNSVDIGFM